MSKKPKKHNDQLLVKIDKDVKKEFISVCENMDTTASREVRRMIKNFVLDNTTTA